MIMKRRKKVNKKTIIISGFPGIGKTYFTENNKEYDAMDSDSSNFSWRTLYNRDSETKERDPDFPENYMQHIKDNIGRVDIILVSSHKEVREALVKNGIFFYLVYPGIELKENCLQRYKGRDNDDKFITFLSDNWSKFIEECAIQTGCAKYILGKYQSLSDAIGEIVHG